MESSKLNTRSGSNPLSTWRRLSKLRVSRPVPTRSTKASATSMATSEDRRGRAVTTRPASPIAARSNRRPAANAGARPTSTPDSTDISDANVNTWALTRTSYAPAARTGSASFANVTASHATEHAGDTANRRQHQAFCQQLTKEPARRGAEGAANREFLIRSVARASCRFARLAQAMSSRNATAASNASSTGRDSASSISRSRATVMESGGSRSG